MKMSRQKQTNKEVAVVTTCELDPNCVGKGGENQSKPGEIFRFVEKLNMCGCISGIKIKKNQCTAFGLIHCL